MKVMLGNDVLLNNVAILSSNSYVLVIYTLASTFSDGDVEVPTLLIPILTTPFSALVCVMLNDETITLCWRGTT